MKPKPKIKVVYIIGSKEHGKYKIGSTTQVEKRLVQLQADAPFKLVVFHTWPHGKYTQLEKFLHRKFESQRVKEPGLRGVEWFAMKEEDLTLAVGYVGEFNLAHPQRFEEFLVAPDRPLFDPNITIQRLQERQSKLLEELDEVNFLLEAAQKAVKEPSAAKLAALEKARAGIGKKPEESGS